MLYRVKLPNSYAMISPSDMDHLAHVLRQWIYRDEALVLTRNALTDPTKFTLDVENRRRFPVSPSYDVLFTVVNPDPENLEVDRGFAHLAQGTYSYGFYKI